VLSRRDALRLGVLSGAALSGLRTGRTSTRHVAVPPAFSVPLGMPPLLRPVRRTATTDYYEITMKEAEAEILPGVRTPVWGYDGAFPGPTIRATTGRRVVVRQTNALPGETSVHLHGGLVPAASDGHPMNPVPAGGSREYVYPNRQPGATLWYHDHAHHREAETVYRGLAGCYLLTDPAEHALGLPGGRHDVLLMLRDARFDDQGELVFSMFDGDGERNVILVNGRPQPYLRVEPRRYRLRLVNASNQRFFRLELDSGDAMTQIASDDGLLAAPVPATTVALSPGERVEVVVDFGRHPSGTRVILRNTDIGATDVTRDVMCFDVAGHPLRDHSRVPDRLAPAPSIGSPSSRVRDITLDFDAVSGDPVINGRVFDPDRVDERVTFGATETWRVTNRDDKTGFRHNFHMHGVHFRVLDRDGVPVTGHETGWKDTVAVPTGTTVRLKARFDGYRGRYLYHCHLLEHSSMGMMAQMEIGA
jgi:FtsP/CotA-like multicopper oxidase with cupredoxin domain